MQLLSNAILFAGVPAVVLVSANISHLWSAPVWLLAIAYTTIALILAAGILVGIFSKAD